MFSPYIASRGCSDVCVIAWHYQAVVVDQAVVVGPLQFYLSISNLNIC